ncbi:hypothetical protein [Pseudoduganella sp. RAF53_2]|uniref:hypothetical protein n=1 Tax=unclassified Pseudoduganella TaxID=2637179 RepID=UPI003F9B1C1F
MPCALHLDSTLIRALADPPSRRAPTRSPRSSPAAGGTRAVIRYVFELNLRDCCAWDESHPEQNQ